MEAEGWELPTDIHLGALVDYIQGLIDDELIAAAGVGGALKDTGTTYWNATNVGATNELSFFARGAGWRDSTGVFQYKDTNYFLKSVTASETIYAGVLQLVNSTVVATIGVNLKKIGESLRPFRLATEAELLLEDGILPNTYYIGNDGKVYECTLIGTQVWITANLAETKFRDLSEIPTVTDNSVWAALTEAAKCAYDNDETNVLI
jgi:hypothetical protein